MLWLCLFRMILKTKFVLGIRYPPSLSWMLIGSGAWASVHASRHSPTACGLHPDYYGIELLMLDKVLSLDFLFI